MAKLFEGDPMKDTYVGAVTSVALIGASFGSFVVMPFSSNPANGENVFLAVWVAVGLTVLAMIGVAIVLVNPPKTEEKEVEVKTPKLAVKLLVMTSIASAFDSGGDVGTQSMPISRGFEPSTSRLSLHLLTTLAPVSGQWRVAPSW